jgi:hypothetical protein
VAGFSPATYFDLAASETFLWLAGRAGALGANPPRLARQPLNPTTWETFTLSAVQDVTGAVMLARRPGTLPGVSILYVTYITKDQVLHVQKSSDDGTTWQEVCTQPLTNISAPNSRVERAFLMAMATKGTDAVVTWADKVPWNPEWRVQAAKESTGWTPVQLNVQGITLVEPGFPFTAVRATFGDYLVGAYTDTQVTLMAGRQGMSSLTIPDLYVLQV